MNQSKIAVLGAGIMGSCLALELAQRGHQIDLYEVASTPMTGASLNNEGKLHLGFVYGKDPLKDTHKVMIRGSLAFKGIIEKLTGQCVEAKFDSEPFHYFIPNDSQLTINEILNHFDNVQSTINQIINSREFQYFDLTEKLYFKENSSEIHEKYFSPRHTQISICTDEISLSTNSIASILKEGLRCERMVNFIGNTKVISARNLANDGVEITSMNRGQIVTKSYQCVANCLWDDKLRIDKTAGINDSGPWIMRYKAMLSISAPSINLNLIPSATGILGPYGDIVNHKNGSYYLSWYPLCKLGETLNDEGRKLHTEIHSFPARVVKKLLSGLPLLSEKVSFITHRKFIKDNILEMSKYIPSVQHFSKYGNSIKVSGGVILAKGSTDIDDPNSYLHQRSVIGPVAYGNYITVDTGKYCTAPLFALETADMITKILS
jgi:hypothetical protein